MNKIFKYYYFGFGCIQIPLQENTRLYSKITQKNPTQKIKQLAERSRRNYVVGWQNKLYNSRKCLINFKLFEEIAEENKSTHYRKLNRSPAEGKGTAETSGSWDKSGRLWMCDRSSSRTW